MSKADEMFQKLGFEKIEKFNIFIMYMSKIGSIWFWHDRKSISIHIPDSQYPSFEMQELQAINEKVKELGWNE